MRGRGRRGLLLVVGALFGMACIAGCGDPPTDCVMATASGSVDATLVAIHGATATFAVAAVHPDPVAKKEGLPIPVAGDRIEVRYELGEEQFLRVGRRYTVTLYPDVRIGSSGGYFSGVHMADHACSGGTVYADGSPIDTAIWRQRWPRRIAAALVIVLVLPAVIIGVSALRTRRRQRKNDERLKARDP